MGFDFGWIFAHLALFFGVHFGDRGTVKLHFLDDGKALLSG